MEMMTIQPGIGTQSGERKILSFKSGVIEVTNPEIACGGLGIQWLGHQKGRGAMLRVLDGSVKFVLRRDGDLYRCLRMKSRVEYDCTVRLT